MMRSKKYYWTLLVLAALVVIFAVADVVGFVGLFTGGKDSAEDVAVDSQIVATDDADGEDDANVPDADGEGDANVPDASGEDDAAESAEAAEEAAETEPDVEDAPAGDADAPVPGDA